MRLQNNDKIERQQQIVRLPFKPSKSVLRKENQSTLTEQHIPTTTLIHVTETESLMGNWNSKQQKHFKKVFF